MDDNCKRNPTAGDELKREVLLKLQQLQVELCIKFCCRPASSHLLKWATALRPVCQRTAGDTQSLSLPLSPP